LAALQKVVWNHRPLRVDIGSVRRQRRRRPDRLTDRVRPHQYRQYDDTHTGGPPARTLRWVPLNIPSPIAPSHCREGTHTRKRPKPSQPPSQKPLVVPTVCSLRQTRALQPSRTSPFCHAGSIASRAERAPAEPHQLWRRSENAPEKSVRPRPRTKVFEP